MPNGEINRKSKVLEEVTILEGIGPILKRVRIEKHISLEEIAEATKIRVKYLQAIEEEHFDVLPGAVYAKGFVNTYIRYLGIGDWPEVVEIMQSTPKPVLAPLVQEEEPVEERHMSRSAGRTKLEDKPITSKKYLIIGLSVVAILALLAVQVIYSRQQPPDDDSLVLPPKTDQVADNEQPKDTQNADEEEPAEEKEPEAVYTGLNLEVQIIDLTPSTVDKCWTTVSADGKNVFTETLNEGAAKTVTAEQTIHIKVGNGGVCQLNLNGQDLGVMGEKGQVVEKTFTLEDVSKSTNTKTPVSATTKQTGENE